MVFREFVLWRRSGNRCEGDGSPFLRFALHSFDQKFPEREVPSVTLYGTIATVL
jgi:hypothetical protein